MFVQLSEIIRLYRADQYGAAIKIVLQMLTDAIDAFDTKGSFGVAATATEGCDDTDGCITKLEAVVADHRTVHASAGDAEAKAIPWNVVLPILLQLLKTWFLK